MGLSVAEQMQNATARPHVDRFLIVTHATFPLSAAVLEGARAHWTSTSGQVAVWLWPQGPPRRAEGGLKLQVGGQGPARDRFVDIDIDGTGQGTVRQDEFGLAPLYVAARDALSFVSNRPDLIALAQHGVLGRWPERDRAFSALLAFKGFPMGDRTGYADVRCVPFLAHVRISGASARLVDPPSPPWAPSRPAADLARAVDELEASAAAQLRQVVDCTTRDGGRPRLELTGGRDSRLVLALATRSGTIDGFDVVTYTGDAQDLRVARQVARCANARHLIEDRPPVADSPFERVRTTSGALNLSESHRANPGSALATVMSGLVGETLSSNFPSTAPLKTRGQVLRAFIEQPNLDLLTEPAWVEAVVETMQLLLAPLAQGADTEDLLDAFYVQHRVRRWISVRPEAFSATAFPLYCPTAVRFAFALGWQGRVEHRLHNAIIERAGRGIARIPYASAKRVGEPLPATIGYPEDGPPVFDAESLRRTVRAWRDRRPCWQLPDAASDPDPRREGATLAARHAAPAKLALYRDIVNADAWNPAFEVIDRQRLLSAVQVLPLLPPHLAKQVHAAMASVIWLGRMEGDEFG